MKDAHSPGPWRWNPAEHSHNVLEDASGEPIVFYDPLFSQAQATANKALLVAAPEMAALLREVQALADTAAECCKCNMALLDAAGQLVTVPGGPRGRTMVDGPDDHPQLFNPAAGDCPRCGRRNYTASDDLEDRIGALGVSVAALLARLPPAPKP